MFGAIATTRNEMSHLSHNHYSRSPRQMSRCDDASPYHSQPSHNCYYGSRLHSHARSHSNPVLHPIRYPIVVSRHTRTPVPRCPPYSVCRYDSRKSVALATPPLRLFERINVHGRNVAHDRSTAPSHVGIDSSQDRFGHRAALCPPRCGVYCEL